MSGLDDESRKSLVEYRLERAYDTMKEAALLTEKGYYNAAVNRFTTPVTTPRQHCC